MSSSTANDMADMGEFLDVAERYQRTFVKPLVDAVVIQVGQHLEAVSTRLNLVEATMKTQADTITGLQGNQKKALVGYGVFSTGLAATLAGVWTWVKSHFHMTTG